MKILPQRINVNPDINNLQNVKKNNAISGTVKKSADYDKIIIGAGNPAGISDDQFIATLKKAIMSEIQAGASERKLNDLKNQIAVDQYEINASDIVKRMMLDNYEVNYD